MSETAATEHAHAEPNAAGGGAAEHVHEVPFDPWTIFFILVGLTAVSWVADLLEMPANVTGVVVMTVALAKASLVAVFFMHLRYEGRWKWFLLLPPLVVAVILALILTPDVGLRHEPY